MAKSGQAESMTIAHGSQQVMKAFESLKRDFRGLYQSKSKVKKRDRAQTLDHGPIEALHRGSAIPLVSVVSTQITDPEVTRPGTAPALQTERSDHVFSDVHQGTAVPAREPGPAGDDLDSPMEDQSDIKRPQSVIQVTEDTVDLAGSSSEAPSDGQQEAAAPEHEEDDPEWTFEEAQSVRDQVYVTFNTEAKDDYTDGPARFMVAQDGVKHCAALLITFGLSQTIQEAILGHREYLRTEKAGLFHRQSVTIGR